MAVRSRLVRKSIHLNINQANRLERAELDSIRAKELAGLALTLEERDKLKEENEKAAKVLQTLIECGALPPPDKLDMLLKQGLSLEAITMTWREKCREEFGADTSSPSFLD